MNTDITPLIHKILGINWRTTACAILPLMTALQKAVEAVSRGELPSATDLMQIGAMFSLAYGLIVAKDRNVTGGSISNVTGAEAVRPVSLADTVPNKPA